MKRSQLINRVLVLFMVVGLISFLSMALSSSSGDDTYIKSVAKRSLGAAISIHHHINEKVQVIIDKLLPGDRFDAGYDQEFNEYVNIPSIDAVTDLELLNISRYIWAADTNSLSLANPAQITIDDIGPTFFTYVNPAHMQVDTFIRMYALLDNYVRVRGTADNHSAAHLIEQQQFLEAIMPTGPMQTLYTFLQQQGLASTNETVFMEELRYYWFTPFRSFPGSIGNDTSGFEHVFVGEIFSNGRRMTGLHNWLQFYNEEVNTDMSYVTHNRLRSCPPTVYNLAVNWTTSTTPGNTIPKPEASMFIGASPEYQVAMFTLCFVTRGGTQCQVEQNNQLFNITTVEQTILNHRTTIKTTFPQC